MVVPPQQYTAKLEEKTVYNDKFTQFSFELIQPNQLQFQAGQYVSIQVSPQGDRRSYSIASSPSIEHGFELLVEILPGGTGSTYLSSLEFGQEISFLAPMGHFTIAENTGEEALVLIATGSGITPYKSMIRDLLQVKRDPRPIQLIWGMRYAQDLFWLDDFTEIAENFPNFSFQPVISKPVPEWTLSTGHVTDVLKLAQQPSNAGYYLCGNEAMISDSKQILERMSVPPERVHHEKFF